MDEERSLRPRELANRGEVRLFKRGPQLDVGTIRFEHVHVSSRPHHSVHFAQQDRGVRGLPQRERRHHAVESPIRQWQTLPIPRLELKLPGNLAQCLASSTCVGVMSSPQA